MNKKKHIITIDAGNSSIKVGQFINDKLKKVKIFGINELRIFNEWLDNKEQNNIIISSVLKEEKTKKIIEILKNKNYYQLNFNTKLPIKIDYKTQDTLGTDRICNAVYSALTSKTKYSVTIDIGTCIKFDLIGEKKNYIGGSISPGIKLRYKSLNDYTGNLPLISNKSKANLLGNDTVSCMHSGVINGLQAEITTMILNYMEKFPNISFFVTGGDLSHFDYEIKNDIFVDANLTLKGLYEIYKYNNA